MSPTGDCPECGKGKLERVVTSRSYDVEGRTIVVQGLMPWQCDTCGAKTWPDEELIRGRKMRDLLASRKAAA